MASALARSILKRSMYIQRTSTDKALNELCRLPRLGAETCAVQVQHARNESNHDRGWYCPVEEEGGRVLLRW